jgi:hypothetical protein
LQKHLDGYRIVKASYNSKAAAAVAADGKDVVLVVQDVYERVLMVWRV